MRKNRKIWNGTLISSKYRVSYLHQLNLKLTHRKLMNNTYKPNKTFSQLSSYSPKTKFSNIKINPFSKKFKPLNKSSNSQDKKFKYSKIKSMIRTVQRSWKRKNLQRKSIMYSTIIQKPKSRLIIYSCWIFSVLNGMNMKTSMKCMKCYWQRLIIWRSS